MTADENYILIAALPENNDDDSANDYDPYQVTYLATRVYDFLDTAVDRRTQAPGGRLRDYVLSERLTASSWRRMIYRIRVQK